MKCVAFKSFLNTAITTASIQCFQVSIIALFIACDQAIATSRQTTPIMGLHVSLRPALRKLLFTVKQFHATKA
jgi:hypothetical protein